MSADRAPKPRGLGGAARIGAGILSSRIFGLARDVLAAFFFGVGPHYDVFRTAFRGPNLLQNLLGEQTLSAAFIPIYSRLLSEGHKEQAARFAGAIFGLLFAAASAVSLAGVLLARPFVAITNPGYLGDAARVVAGELSVDRFELAVTAVRLLFPMALFLVLAAWTLGVLNSHRRFFLPYFAPVLWNAALIGGLVYAGWELLGAGGRAAVAGDQSRILLAAFVGGLVGGVLQFAVQLPLAVRLTGGFRPSMSLQTTGVAEAIRSFTPVLAARGAAQLSSYVDTLLASLLFAGAQSALGYAQTLYLLPISLFALSVAAAELPELSRRGELAQGELAVRTVKAVRRISFFVVPTQVGYIAFGLLIIAGLYRRGEFGAADNWVVYAVLAAYSMGLLATAWSRMLTNVFYAEGETRTPARIAVARIVLSLAIGVALMIWLDRVSVDSLVGDAGLVGALGDKGGRLRLGAVGLAIGSAFAAWFEWLRLRSGLRRLELSVAWPTAHVLAAYGRALVALAGGAALWYLVRDWAYLPAAALVLVGYASAYLVLSKIQSVPEAADLLSVFKRGPRSGD